MTSQKPMSIRTLLVVTTGLLTLIIAISAMRDVFMEWERTQHIHELKEATYVGDMLFEAADKISVERDLTYSILSANDSDVPALQPSLVSSRQAVDESLNTIFAILLHYDFLAVTKLAEQSKQQFANLQNLRIKVDAALQLPLAKRDAALSTQWFSAATDNIASIQSTWVEFIKHFINVDQIVTRHMRFKHLLGTIMEYTGRERAIISRLIVSNQDITPEDQANLLRWQGDSDLAWKYSNMFADHSGLSAVINTYFNDAQSHYLTLYYMVKDLFYIPGRTHGTNYPITIDMWTELSSQTTDSLYALKDAAVAETQRYVEALEHDARKAIITHSMLLIFALGLCICSFWVIFCRVLNPIHTIVEALFDLSQGKISALPMSKTNRDDEIGQLQQVLYSFHKSQEKYRALTEASSQIIWTWQPGETGELSALMQWWEQTTGTPGHSVINFGWLESVHPEDRENARKTWAEASTKGKAFEMEYRLLTRQGNYLHIAVRGVPLLNADGSLSEFVGALNDITIRKEAEENLLRYTRALERSNRELDDFAYIASHDLKEPLRGIHNHSRFLMEDNHDKLDPDSASRLERLIYLSQRMERLVNDLLYFSRLGRQELAIRPTNLNLIIHDIENTLDVFLQEHKVRIVVPKLLPTITCDTPRITEVFRNLITNAAKYNDNPEKLIEIGFLETAPLPDDSLAKNVLYVKDNGRGIAKEFHDEIFRIFKRLQSSKNQETEGTGVGLTFVKKIIERHGGRIWLTSEPGKGTTFYFILEGVSYDQKAVA